MRQPIKPKSTASDSETAGSLAPAGSVIFGRDISAKTFHRALVFLGLLGLIVRIGFFVEHAHNPSFAVPTLDQRYYDTVARMLLAGDDLRELHGFRPLLYPMFLAVFYKLGGAWGPALAIMVQHLLGVATGLIAAVLGARLFRHRIAGLIGGLLYLLAPLPLSFEGELLIEPSYIFLIVGALWLHVKAAEARGWQAGALWLLGGALIVLTAQARANILVFLAVYPGFAAWRWWRMREVAAWRPLLGLLGAFCMMIPWGLINMRQSDHFHLLPNAGGVSFYVGNRRGADGMLVGENVIQSLSKLSLANGRETNGTLPLNGRRIDSGGRYQDLVEVWASQEYVADMLVHGREPSSDPMAVSAYWSARAINEIKAAPGPWLKLMAKKCWLMLWNAEIPNNKDFRFQQQEYLSLRLLPVCWAVLLILAPAGIWAAWRSGNRAGLFILGFYAVCYSAANVAFFICDRYRYPIWPAMAIFAGGGLPAGLEILRRRNPIHIAVFFLSVALMTAVSLPNWFHAILPSFAQDYYFRSLADYEKGFLPQALADVDQSIALYPLDAGPLHHRGNVLFALEHFNEAAQAYDQTLQLAPGDSGVWNNLGVTLDALGKTQDARQAFQHATEGRLPSQNAFLGLAALQLRAGQLDDAALTLTHLHQLKPVADATELALRSILARRRGDTQQADTLEKQSRALDLTAMAWAVKHASSQ